MAENNRVIDRDDNDYPPAVRPIVISTPSRERPGEHFLPGCGHYTGRCGKCGSTDLWDDNAAYGCNRCGSFWCGFA